MGFAPALARRPDTPLADLAERMLQAAAPPALVAHCHRTYAYAEAILDHRGLSPDRETLFLGATLHDLGLTPTWEDPSTPFEEHGAAVAHEALVRHGAPPELADLVHDAIRLHLDLTTGDDHRPEVAGIHLGSAADVLGLRLDEIPAPTIELILKTHPAEGLAPFLHDAFTREAQHKPHCATAVLIRDFHLLDTLRHA
ncbi:HD domain-containing protein [Streptomyces sp. NBC_01237]|uniref:HD domain-containing protein n=1 Tax=Streptomyces sp. NBC_01237 TaxID=2903790 RepID=UPI002DD7B9FE|nr:HD domain-containing protein [Streptomyces sp. NBC_01237]WRZ77304.1 HD domain-containing protein [Streptomyces sp. NBC_01237]